MDMIDDVHQMQGLSQKSRLGNLTRFDPPQHEEALLVSNASNPGLQTGVRVH